MDKADFGCLEVEEDKPLNGPGDDEYRLFDKDEVCLSVLHVNNTCQWLSYLLVAFFDDFFLVKYVLNSFSLIMQLMVFC